MSEGGGKFTALTEDLHDYIVDNGSREDPVLVGIRERTAELGDVSVMQVSPDQGAFLELLARLLGARRAIELGTFTGYSAICIARGLAEDGVLVACELDPEHAEIARGNFESAGLKERIELRVGPAAATLAELVREGDSIGSFDLAFIDADKVGYRDYYEAGLRLLRPGGLVVVDNVLLGGRVLDPDDEDASARAIAELNEAIVIDSRVDVAMLGVADGITLARKR